jgi:signal transduction histidine kinase/ActR/RegA family two-component response regulator
MPLPLSSKSPDQTAATPTVIASVKLAFEQDVVLARQRARLIAEQLGFDAQNQVRIATAVSEIAREGLQQGGLAAIEFIIDPASSRLMIRVHLGEGPRPTTIDNFRAAEGIVAVRRILGNFTVEAVGETWMGVFVKALPPRVWEAGFLKTVCDAVSSAEPRGLYQEFQGQSQELLNTLNELKLQQIELAKVTRELEETNRGVVALYAELDEKAESLARVTSQKNGFFSSISHEFRTPVTSIMSLSQILLNRLDGELNTEQERQVSLIHTCSQNLLEWVNDLLDLARVDAGRMELRLGTFKVAAMLTGLRGVMRSLATNNQVDLAIVDVDEHWEMHSDEGKLSQVLRNFVSNALKFTERGEVRVLAERAADNQSIRFAVKDTGIGIAPQDLDRIFEEFVQIESPAQSTTKGTGLGLPLCKRLAELLGGAIEVRSSPGEGSEFTLTVPCNISRGDHSGASDAEQDFPPMPALQDVPHPRVLLIDDDDAARYLLIQELSVLRINVVEAENGTAGIKMARALLPEAIFLDLKMPDLSGFAVLELLRREEETREIPVVIFSSEDLTEGEMRHLKSLRCAVLPKPGGTDVLSAVRLVEALTVAGYTPTPEAAP